MRLIGLAIVLGLTLAPLAAEAQSAAKVHRIGYLSLQRVDGDRSWVAAFRQGLRDLGYVEGENVVIQQRHAAGQAEKLPELAAELLGLKIDVLVVYGIWALKDAGWKAPGTLPIVFTVDADPVGKGLVGSLARPGGNITGLSDAHADLVPKRLELLKEVIPSVARVGVLVNPDNTGAASQLKTAQAAAPALGLTVLPIEVKGRERGDMDLVFARMGQLRLGGLVIIGDPTVSVHRKRIGELVVQTRLPAVSTVREWAEAGLLMAYGTSFHELWRRTATYVDKILKGAKPADLPVEQPTKFELVINLKTAKALGLTIPQSLLVRADQVIR
ncbi:MAG: ABC transporter substrate-binding protein [Candidatus Rokuibacteriota bacterium]